MFFAAEGRLFGLDMQLIFGMLFQIIAILILFVALTYILYEPVRKVLNDRKERIASDVASAKQSRIEAGKYKAEYEAKLKSITKEADTILEEARGKAKAKEKEMIARAKEEKAGIIAHARRDAELERKKSQEAIKQQIIEVATVMAGKIVAVSLDEKKQRELIEETWKEMSEEAWRNE